MNNVQSLTLDKIKVDPDIQVRARIDDTVVDEYLAAMDAGDKFPPGVVFCDGETYWLADGFTRLMAIAKGDGRSMPVEIIEGTREDAAWYALAANRTHGVRLTHEDKTRAIKRAIKMRPHESNRLIAEHIGVDDKTVGRYRDEMESTAEIPQLKTRTGADGKARPATRPEPKPEPKVATNPAKAPATEPDEKPEPESLRDKTGVEIPEGPIADLFRRDHELVALWTQMGEIRKTVLDGIKANDPLYRFFTPGAWDADSANIRQSISNARPYAICRYCGGQACKACNETGVLNELNYKMAPEELK